MNEITKTDLQLAIDIFNELPDALCNYGAVSTDHTDDVYVRDMAESITRCFQQFLSQKSYNSNDKLRAGAAFLAGLISNTTGNSLSEVYIRVRRLLFHHCVELTTVFPTWFKPTELNEITKKDDGALTFEEDIIYGLQFPLEKINVNFPWHENIIAMWHYGSTQILSISDYEKIDLATIQNKLDHLLMISAITPDLMGNKEITKIAPKNNLRKWWALVQVVFNCPLDNLWWYPGTSIIRWLAANRCWEVGYLQPCPELRPVTIQNMARNIKTIWQYSAWVEITKFRLDSSVNKSC